MGVKKAVEPRQPYLGRAGKVLLWGIGILVALFVVASQDNPSQMVAVMLICGVGSYVFNNWESDRAYTRAMLDKQAKEMYAMQQVLADLQYRMTRLDRDRGAER